MPRSCSGLRESNNASGKGGRIRYNYNKLLGDKGIDS